LVRIPWGSPKPFFRPLTFHGGILWAWKGCDASPKCHFWCGCRGGGQIRKNFFFGLIPIFLTCRIRICQQNGLMRRPLCFTLAPTCTMAFETKIVTRKSRRKGNTTILLYTIKMWPRPQAIRILVYIRHILPSFAVLYASLCKV
jgi:hypothetical protein